MIKLLETTTEKEALALARPAERRKGVPDVTDALRANERLINGTDHYRPDDAHREPVYDISEEIDRLAGTKGNGFSGNGKYSKL